MWSPGYRDRLNRLDDVVINSPFQGALLRYDADQSEWRVPPQTSKSILEGATETVEIYYYSITTDTQQFRSAQSDTPSEGNKIVRKIWYSTTAQEDIDSGTWTLLETLDDNATYLELVDAFEDQLKTSPGGDTPVSIKTTWAEVEEFTGLLDTYTGAAAAYSLRRLAGTYTGAAIRVRRDSDDAEQDIGFDSNGDLDTTALATFCSGTDGFVKVWYDQAGSNDAEQTTTGSQPKIYDSSTGVVINANSLRPSLLFLTSRLISTTLSVNGSLSVFGVGESNSIFRDTIFDSFESTSTAELRIQSPMKYLIGDGNLVPQVDTHYLFSAVQISGVSFTGYYNGNLDLTTSTTTAELDGISIGVMRGNPNPLSGTTYMNGYIDEIVIYDSDQSSNRTGIETNINDYFGIYTPFTTGLLDDYSGAAAAYSLRRLSSTYTGPAIRVRRASDNAEQDIEFDIEGNLNTGALAGFCSGTDGFVKVWYCQSGNGNDATQTTTGSQPKIYDSVTGVVLENGKAAILFDGVDDGYLTPLASSDPSTFFIICDNNGNSGKTPASPTQVNAFFIDQLTYLRVRVNGIEFQTATQASAEFQLQYILQDTTSSEAAVNGATATSGTLDAVNGTVVSIGQAPLGGRWSGHIYELIIYQNDQSANRTGIETNINDHYSIYTP